MTAFRNVPRHVVDVEKGLTLVFPDTLVLKLVSEKSDAATGMLILSLAMEASTDDLAHFPAAREIRLTDLRFSVAKPQDDDILSFDFVQIDAVAKATVVLVVNGSAVSRIKTRLATDPGFMSPQYRGNSEEYSSIVVIASAHLDDKKAAEINQTSLNIGFVQAISRLVEEVAITSSSTKLTLALANRALEETAEIWATGSTPNRTWNIRLPIPVPEITIKEPRPKVDLIVGSSKEITIKWEE